MAIAPGRFLAPDGARASGAGERNLSSRLPSGDRAEHGRRRPRQPLERPRRRSVLPRGTAVAQDLRHGRRAERGVHAPAGHPHPGRPARRGGSGPGEPRLRHLRRPAGRPGESGRPARQAAGARGGPPAARQRERSRERAPTHLARTARPPTARSPRTARRAPRRRRRRPGFADTRSPRAAGP